MRDSSRSAVKKKLSPFHFISFFFAVALSASAWSSSAALTFNISKQNLDDALVSLAEQSGTSIVGQTQLTAQKKAPPLLGEMTLEDALKILLAETGISFEIIDNEIIVLTSSPTPNTAQPSTTVQQEPPPIIEETMVTGARISQYYADEFVTGTRLSSHDIISHQVINIDDLRSSVPSIQLSSIGDHDTSKLFIRGITTFDYTETGDQSITHYRDGIYQPRQQHTSPLLFDIDRIEVLRGPQGNQYGRSALGGAINVYAQKPEQELGARGVMTFGSEDRLFSELAINAPITNAWALRAAGALETQDGDIAFQNPALEGERAYGATDAAAYRLSSLFKPSNDLSWLISFENFEDRGTGTIPTLSATQRTTQSTTPGYVHFNLESIKNRLDYKTGNLAISYLSGGSRFNRSQLWSPQLPGNNLGDYTAHTRGLKNTSYQHEVQLRNITPLNDKLNWLIGAFYFKEQNNIRFDLRQPLEDAIAAGEIRTQIAYVQPNRQAITHSVFGQLDYSFTPTLRAVGGLRYSHEERFDIGGKSVFCTEHFIQLPEAAPSQNAFEQAGNADCWIGEYNDSRGEWNKVTGSLRLEWKPTPTETLYLAYASGWKPGNVIDGVNANDSEGQANTTLNNALTLQPESNHVIETGLHSSVFDNALHINTNAFYMQHKNMQANTYNGENRTDGTAAFSRNNNAESIVAGLEVNLNWDLSRGWYATSSISTLYSRYKKMVTEDSLFPQTDSTSSYQSPTHWNPCYIKEENGQCQDGALNLEGNQLPYAPTLAAYLHIEKRIAFAHGEITPSAQIYHQTKMYFTPENRKHRPAGFINQADPGEKYFDAQREYTTLDLTISYQPTGKGWRIDLFGTNVTNSEIRQGVELDRTRLENYYYWDKTREIGLRFSSDFM